MSHDEDRTTHDDAAAAPTESERESVASAQDGTSRRAFIVGAAGALSSAAIAGCAADVATEPDTVEQDPQALHLGGARVQTLARINLAPDGLHPGPPTLTPDGQKLLIPNQESDNLQILDATTLEVHSTLAFPAGSVPWTAAVTPDGRRALVSLSRFGDPASVPSSVALVELFGIPWISRFIRVGAGPNGVVIDRHGRRAYVANQRSNTVSVIDIQSLLTLHWRVIDTIPVGNAPHSLGFHDDRLFVVNFADASVSEIDTRERVVTRTVTVGNPTLTQPFPQFGPGDTTQFAVGADGFGYAVNYRSNDIVAVDLRSFSVSNRQPSPVVNPYSVRRASDLLFVSSEIAGSTFLLETPGAGVFTVVDEIRADCGSFPRTTRVDDFVVWSNLPSTDSILRFSGRAAINPLVSEAL